MSTIKKQSHLNPPNLRSSSDQPKDHKVLSPSTDVKEYFQYTRNFPSSNPIKSARPDLLSFVERIPMTTNPGGPSLLNRRDLLRRSQRANESEDKENVENHLLGEIDRLNEELRGKEEEIKRLKGRNQELEKMSNDLKGSVHSFSGTPMKERDAKDLAKRFAKERLQAEIDAEEWRNRYKALEKKFREIELAEPKEIIVKKEVLPIKDPKEQQLLQQKILDFENRILSLTNENDKLKSIVKERNTEIDNLKIRLGSKDREIDELKTDIRKLGDKTPLDAKFKDLSSQIEIWRNKANLLEEQWDKEQKRSKDLQESRDKFEQDLKNVKNDLDQAKRLIAKYENTVLELERLRSEAEISRKKHEELEVFRKRNEELESRIKSLISELETLKQRLGSFEDIPEKHLKELEIWSNRCDEIEREWSEKYKQLEFEMDELSLMANNLKEFEDQILLLQAENENWKQKCLEIESEWSQKHAQALRSLPEDLKHGNSLEKQELIGALFLLMLEVERLNMLIKLLEEEKDKTLEFSHLKHQEKEKKAVFDRDLQGATAKLEEIIKSKEGVIENFRQKLKENEGRIEKVTRENAILKERVKKFDDDSRFQADSLKGSLESEIRRLKLLNESLQQETEQFRSKYYEEMRKKGDNFENENRICLLAAENERLTKENEVLMRKYSEEINKGNKGGTEIENRLALAINDKERLLRELEQYKYKQNEEDRLLRELDQYKSKYYEEVSKKTPSTYEIENKLALITTENTRLLSENDYWRRVSQEAEEKMRKTTENSFTTKAQSSYLEQDFKEKNKALIEENEEIKLKITRLENEYKRFVENSSANSSEVMNLEFELEMKGKKLRELELLLQDKNEFSSIRSEQLFKENERIKSELEEQKRKFSILELENYKRGSTDNEFTRKTGVLEAELDRIRSLLEDKTRETKGLMENNMQKARDYEESLMRLRIAENQMAVLDSKTKGLIEEIEAWRSRYENLERFKAREFEDLRTHTEAIRKSQLDREIRDLTIKHQNERMKLEAENKRLEGLLELRNGELVILKGRDQREGKIPRLEERVFLLTSEIERLLGLTQSLNEKIHELEDGKLRLSEFYQDQQKSNFETTKKSQVYQVENLQNEVNVLQKDLEEWKGKARRAELEIYGVSTMNQTISELKQQIQVLNKDQQGLIESLKEKTNYIEKLKLKKRGLKSKIRSSFSPEQANSSYYREIEALKSENQLIKEELSKKSFEKQGETEVKVRYLEQELREKEQDLSEWRQKYYQAKSEGTYLVKPQEEFLPIQRSPVHEEHIKKAFIHEGENLQSKVNALTEELETWKDKCHRLESSSAEKSLWEKKARDWEQKVQILLADNERLIMEKTLLEQRFISSSSETLDRSKLQRLEEQRMQEIEELKMHLELLKTAGLVDSHGLEYEAERIAYETALNQMKARIMELERSLAIAERDAEENKKLFGGKLREVEELRGKGIGFTSQTRVSGDLDDLKIENDRLKRMCSDGKEAIWRLESERRSLEMQLEEKTALVRSLQGETEKLGMLLEERKRERDEALKKIDDLKNENQRLNIVSSQSTFQTSENFSFQEKNELLRKIQDIEGMREFYKSQAERNSRDLTAKNLELIEKIQELENLKAKYQDALNNVQCLESKLLEKLQNEEIILG